LADPQGREVVRILGARKHGQWTGKVLAEVIKWQLGHPGGTKEQCSEWLKEELAAGRISIEDEAPSYQAKRQRGGPKEATAKKTRT
jgi:tRNA nucleotidyltransferase (CCA-adding enzyme)